MENSLFPPLQLPWRRLHLVGVCGAGMKALAELLLDCGCKVSGSDQQLVPRNIGPLLRRGLHFQQGHAAAHVPEGTELLVYSAAVPAGNVERQAAHERGIPQLAYHDCVGRLMRGKAGICIAGTHGKSTTTALVTHLLRHAGLECSALFGAEMCDSSRSGWAGRGSHFVVESCEFQRAFLSYAPQAAVLLNLEPDHFDCYPDVTALEEAFTQFAGRVQPAQRDGVLLIPHDNPQLGQIAKQSVARVVTFGQHPGCDWHATNVRPSPTGTAFDLWCRDVQVARLRVPLPGEHNVGNAIAACALAAELGVSAQHLEGGLASFAGIKRRLEMIGISRGSVLLDDYAHHPTALRSTLAAVRSMWGQRRLWCVFQPHQASRTTALLEEFSTSFDLADEIIIAPVYAAREQQKTEHFQLAFQLARQIHRRNKSAQALASLDQIVATLDDSLRPGDILLTAGAGDIDRIHHEFTRRVQRNPAPRRAFGAVHLDETGGACAILPRPA